MCLRGCNRGSTRLISPVPYHRPTPACLFPTSRQLGGIDASCLRDRIQTATFLVPFLSPPFPAWNRFTHLASCILHKDEKSPVVVFSTLGLAPVFFLPSWCLCLRLGCCVPTLVGCAWRDDDGARARPAADCNGAERFWQKARSSRGREPRDLVAYCHQAVNKATMHWKFRWSFRRRTEQEQQAGRPGITENGSDRNSRFQRRIRVLQLVSAQAQLGIAPNVRMGAQESSATGRTMRQGA